MTMIDWAQAFASRFHALADGKADMGDLLDWGYELYRPKYDVDPGVVAQTEWDGQSS